MRFSMKMIGFIGFEHKSSLKELLQFPPIPYCTIENIYKFGILNFTEFRISLHVSKSKKYVSL